MANISLITSDGFTLSVPVEAAELSPAIMEKLAEDGNEVFIDKHKGNTLRKIFNFLSHQTIQDEEKKKKVNAAFLKGERVPLAELFATALAAHDLGIQVLEDLMIQRIAHKITYLPAFFVDRMFERDTDFTAEQVTFIKDQYGWAFHGGRRDGAPAPPPSE